MAMPAAYALALLAGLYPTRPADLIAAALGAAALLAVACALRPTLARAAAGTRPATPPGAVLRERARRTGVLRQRDPDARGRRRPRAPALHPSAA